MSKLDTLIDDVIGGLKGVMEDFEKDVKKSTGYSLEEISKMDTSTEEGKAKFKECVDKMIDTFTNKEEPKRLSADEKCENKEDEKECKCRKRPECHIKQLERGIMFTGNGNPGELVFMMSTCIGNVLGGDLGKMDKEDLDDIMNIITKQIKDSYQNIINKEEE